MMQFLVDSTLWNWPSLVWLAVLGLAGLYGWLWRGRLTSRSWWFVFAMSVLLLAFVSPIGVLAKGYLFSAHMVQHLLLLLVVPLCVMLSLPKDRFAVGLENLLPVRVRRIVTAPLLGWICGLGTMWLWHVPSLCSAATESTALGIVRSVSFLMAGLAFWWPIYSPVKRRRLPPLSAVIYLFSACLGCTLLGIYITFTNVSVCPAFANPVDRIGIVTMLHKAGLTSSVDQQLGGLLMWVPPCSLYVCAIIGVLCRWYATDTLAHGQTSLGTPRMTSASS